MLLPKRIWKDIAGYEGKYQVSNTGQVRSLNYRGTGKTKIRKLSTDKNGYKYIILRKNGKLKWYLVHRLVAQTFIPNPNNLPQVNHINEVKDDNRVCNLEWCTSSYNINYGTRNERDSIVKKGNKNGMAKPVLMFTKEGEFIRRFDCIADANEYLGKNRQNTNISICARGKSKTAWNYIWKLDD